MGLPLEFAEFLEFDMVDALVYCMFTSRYATISYQWRVKGGPTVDLGPSTYHTHGPMSELASNHIS